MLFSTLFFLLIFSRYALGGEVKVAAGDEAVFRPEKPLPSPINSIAWKHRSSGVVVIAIEWDEDGFNTPNDRFKEITILNEKTGIMKIKPVNFNHIGEYFFEVNSKEQEEKFTLIVANRVQKPVIIIEPTENPNVVYLRCEYSETIIWRNSDGKTLKGSAITPKGESITVTKNGDPGNFYTCSLRNDVSEETSDRIYEKDLFKDVPGGLSAGEIVGILFAVAIIIAIICAAVYLYKRYKTSGVPVPHLLRFKDETKQRGDEEEKPKGTDNQPAQPTGNGDAKSDPTDQIIEIDETKQRGDEEEKPKGLKNVEQEGNPLANITDNQPAPKTGNGDAVEQGGEDAKPNVDPERQNVVSPVTPQETDPLMEERKD